MSGPIITMPEVPVLGIPQGEKDAGQRVDLKPSKFDLLIENKGYLLAWTRASVCPCAPVTDKSTQADPNCTLCEGKGWYYFGGNQIQDLSGYNFDPIQQKIIDDSGAMIIRGIITSIANDYDTLLKLGNWQTGSMHLTVRHEHKLGIYDKVVALNPEIVHSQVVVADGTNYLPTRYLITGVNRVQGYDSDTDAPVDYEVGTDYERNEQGQLEWMVGKAPSSGTRIAIHYTCHPTYLVTEHPHVVRSTLKKFKTDPATLTTPLGDPYSLPIQAVVRYDFNP